MKNKKLYKIQYIRRSEDETTKIQEAIVSAWQIERIHTIPWIIVLSQKEYCGNKCCISILE